MKYTGTSIFSKPVSQWTSEKFSSGIFLGLFLHLILNSQISVLVETKIF
jgi:hypothetical protein